MAPIQTIVLHCVRHAEGRPDLRPNGFWARGTPRVSYLLYIRQSLLRQWFDAEPERTGRELFERLQAEHPGVYPDGQLRTLQRRLKGWRREAARRLVFATSTVEPGFATGA